MGIHRRSLGALAAAALVSPPLPPRGAAAQAGSVVDVLAADGRFVRFLDLIARAGLADQLRGDGPFTVFAPTDQVFAGGHGSRLEGLLDQSTGDRSPGPGGGVVSGAGPDPVRLSAFVGYFIVPGEALALAQLTAPGNPHPQTMNGTPIAVRARPGEMPTVSGAGGLNIIRPFRVVQADIPAANGIIHALGGVPFP
jgi:uncharacterized surface protein with fasciclin (FAS1) repeats